MRAAVWTGSEIEIAEVAAQIPARGMAEIDVAYVGLCGTDIHILEGTHPRARPGLVLGHEFVGRVRGTSRRVFVNPFVPDGSCQTCRQGHQHMCPHLQIIGVDSPGALSGRVSAPVENLVSLPDSVSLRDAAIIEPLATAVRAVKRSEVGNGSSVHIFGFGPIGYLIGHLCKLAGAGQVTVSEPSQYRARIAQKLGFAVSDDAHPADVVFDCVGSILVASQLTAWARIAGVIVVVGLHPGQAPTNFQDITMHELTLLGSKAYDADDVNSAVSLLSSNEVPIDPLITATVSLDYVGNALDRMRRGLGLKVLVQLGAGE